MKKHKVSFLMTIYNHQNYLKDSITSIINQSYKNWELIAIDNGSGAAVWYIAGGQGYVIS